MADAEFSVERFGGVDDMFRSMTDSKDNRTIGMYAGGDDFFVLKPKREDLGSLAHADPAGPAPMIAYS